MKRLTVILVVSFTCLVTASEESLEWDTNMLKMSSSCMEGLRVCQDFIANQHCLSQTIWKRADATGPFWANRGKRDPNLISSRLYAEVPHWKLVRRDDDSVFDPFFTTRGKKPADAARGRRAGEKLFIEGASPFLAARGKKDDLHLTI